jgi:hypothetical protein
MQTHLNDAPFHLQFEFSAVHNPGIQDSPSFFPAWIFSIELLNKLEKKIIF